uniref:Uncharacterized protein n=1 Tax=Arundo donax TaxID=35708 RepID=A0A0A9F8A9_ARUDO
MQYSFILSFLFNFFTNIYS